MNNLLNEKYIGSTFGLLGSRGHFVKLKIELKNSDYIIKYTDDGDKIVNQIIFTGPTVYFGTSRFGKDFQYDHIVGLQITKPDGESKEYMKTKAKGGRKASVKKEICGKLRCIYKIQGSRKEHIKYKGSLITVADYKKLMKKA
jgi:tRNA(Glu) U13 pseudouridine synthase TruD